ncbi:MAG: ABC transporter substrate-binding protein [Elusimicrobia bacterium]|nr:ABC transporter substrate-binding protein [Elusimicrobiota bacterium]
MRILVALLLGLAVNGRAAQDSLVLSDDVADPVTLDPHHAFENKSDNVILQMFEGLLRFNAKGEIEPALATECVQADPLTLRCRLREGVVFHNGEPFDAEAVRWSLSRQLDPATAYPAAMELASIQEARVVDPRVVEIRTRQPDGLLRHRLASFVKILPPKYFAEAGAQRFAEAPVGTGPFRFLEWERGKAIRLAANERYWEKGLPRLKRVTFLFVPEEKQRAMLYAGELDLMTEIPATRTLEVVKNETTKIIKKLVLTTPVFWFTSFEGPLGDRRARQALNMAANKEQLVRYAVLGNGQTLATMSMRGEEGHNEALKPYRYSVSEAKKLLAEAGYPRGFALTMLSTEQSAREAKILVEQWRKIGVDAALTVLPLGDVHKSMIGGRDVFGVTANLAPNPTAHMYFLPGVCFYSRSLFSRLKSPEFDGLYERLLRAVDPAEHRRLARELDAWIYREALGVFTYQKIRTYAANRKLELDIPVTGILTLTEAHWRP